MNSGDKPNRVYKLLYVEDDFPSRDSFQRLYSHYYDVDVAENANEAIEQAEKNDYDAFIIDINLGTSIDGIKLTRILKDMEGNKDKPYIAFTSYVDRHYRDEFLSKGFTHFVGKPILLEDFIYQLERIVGPPKKQPSRRSYRAFNSTGS